ncbi:hypothetical protein [Chryseobacterium sediminis]|uniref:hypothetical protein n=1 Tax=Chryseobacterium sediminis TaxID=1679494 RepID=UPI00285B5B2F|nr:hypothetical protein [Chryseobacterium sediminis]MDR6466147.1 hypothetical protein [Chryseobacterium sediminis]
MIRVNAQMTCTPTNFNDITIMNTNGGTNTSNGLQIQISGSGNLQVNRNGFNQIHAGNLVSGNPNSSTFRAGVILVIGTDIYTTGDLLFGGGSGGYIAPISSTCNNIGNNYQHIINFSLTKGTLVYGLKLTYSYTYPNLFFTVKYDVVIPPGNTDSVKLSHGWDTFLVAGDKGPGFVSGTGANLTVGTQKAVSGEMAYEAFKYKSGKAWDGYYSATINTFPNNLFNNDYIYDKTIDTNVDTDNAMGISINYGSAPGSFSTTNDIIFNCNSPTTAPTFSSTSIAFACGSPSINLKSGYTGIAESSLPAGVTLDFYDSLGNKIADPTNVTSPGTYTVFYSDANNAGCTSPSTTLTVAGPNCCATAPLLTANTLTNICPSQTANLTSLYSGTLPSGVVLEWHTGSTPSAANLVAAPNAVGNGTYWAVFHDVTNSCYSPASSVAVTISPCLCYKPAVTSGTALGATFGITSLNRATANGSWPAVRKGAWVVMESKTKGFVPNRLTSAQVAAIPPAELIEGMMVYNKDLDCLQINTDGTAAGWKCLITQTCPDY